MTVYGRWLPMRDLAAVDRLDDAGRAPVTTDP
jgi:hypothetical protein